jgi:hypothetical protein
MVRITVGAGGVGEAGVRNSSAVRGWCLECYSSLSLYSRHYSSDSEALRSLALCVFSPPPPHTTKFPDGDGSDFWTIRVTLPPPPQRVWMTGRLLSCGFAGSRQYVPDKYDFCVCLQLGMNVVFKKPKLKQPYIFSLSLSLPPPPVVPCVLILSKSSYSWYIVLPVVHQLVNKRI